MEHRTVPITGCSSGIGRTTAKSFYENGWSVYATARNTEEIKHLAEVGTEILELDVTAEEDVENAVETVVEENGGIGCIVNNAGYGETSVVEDLRSQFEANTYGPQRLMREALPYMREQGDGTVINMSSVGGRLSQPGIGAYCASKFALEALSDAARAEVRWFGFDFVLVEPGPVNTPFEEKAEEN
jgi:NAD(P)-dependent dehydrogenase (short-subunit alcohol dehydrogenase family)